MTTDPQTISGQEATQRHCSHENTVLEGDTLEPASATEPPEHRTYVVCTECYKEWHDPEEAREDGVMPESHDDSYPGELPF